MYETILDDRVNDVLPAPDSAGNFAYGAQFRHYRTLQAGAAVLAFALAVSVSANLWSAMRPPTVMVVRVDDAGRTSLLRYPGLSYTPREAEIRSRLNDWAIDRYRLLKPVAGANFKLNYDYLSSALAQKLMPQDAPRLAKILAGSEPEQDVAVENIQFTAIDPRKLPDGAVASGGAVIDLIKIINPSGQNERQHWTVTVQYEVDPVAAAKRGETDPEFENINPLGVAITWFHEDRAFS